MNEDIQEKSHILVTFVGCNLMKEVTFKGTSMKSCKCDKCGKSYQYRSSLLRHTLSCNGLEVVNTHNSFECPTCKTTFQRKDTPSDHIHGVHQKKQKYRCNNCNRSFLWRSSLARHKCQNM